VISSESRPGFDRRFSNAPSRLIVLITGRWLGVFCVSREALLAQTFVVLADSLTDDFDVVDVLTVLVDRANEILRARSGGILLADGAGALTVMAASSEEARLVEVFQTRDDGPCVECVRRGRPVMSTDLAVEGRWPNFTRLALGAGYHAVHAFPLRSRSIVLGGLDVLFEDIVTLRADDVAIAQAMADVATIAVLQHRAAHEAATVVGQLQMALRSRIIIEQAKGVLAERTRITTDEAFSRLRDFARSHNTRLSEVARQLVEGTLPMQDVTILATGPQPNRRHRWK
jgi:GAF domain-containing protein